MQKFTIVVASAYGRSSFVCQVYRSSRRAAFISALLIAISVSTGERRHFFII